MKTNILKIQAVLLCCIMTLTFTSCSNSKEPSEEPESIETPVSEPELDIIPENEENEGEDQDNISKPSSELSNDIRSQQCEINGVVYTFPVESVQQFLDNGWHTEDALDFTLPANTRTSGYTFKNDDGHRIVLEFLNSSDSTKDIMECYVESVSLSPSAAQTGVTLTLPGGIQIGSSYDEIIAAYGQADEESPLPDTDVVDLTYGNAYNKVSLTLNGGELNSIYVWFTTPA